MARYAERTKVPVSSSRAEVERLLQRYGADQFLYAAESGRAMVGFRMQERQIRITINVPADDPQEERRMWRALVLALKSKLESVESGIETFDEAFLAHVVTPDGTTVGEWAKEQIKVMYERGSMPKLLPGPK